MERVTQLPVSREPENTGLAVRTLEDVMKLSDFLAKSELIPVYLRKKPADVAIILMKGHELGLAPMQAIDSIDVIQGKPALKPEAQLALIYQKVPNAHIAIKVDSKVMSVTVQMGRVDGKPTFETVWDMNRARQMGLDKKDNYIKQPLTMLKWRAVGEAARTVFPDITRGLYNTEEVQDFHEERGEGNAAGIKAAFTKPEPKEVKAEVVDAPAPESVMEEVGPEPMADSPRDLGAYVPQMSAWPKGKKLSDYKPDQLQKILDGAKEFVAKNPTKAGPDWQEFIQVTQEYLFKPEEPSFESFLPDMVK